MKVSKAICITLFSLFAISSLSGCSDETEMTQEEIQYIGHIDQARFFQRQGELKASTLEARSANELQPNQPEPYFIIIDNLLKAGDAKSALRQLEQLMEGIPEESLTPEVANKANLIRAEAQMRQGKLEEAIAALDAISSPDRTVETDAALLRGEVNLRSQELDAAEDAFQNARSMSTSSALPIIGMSRVEFARENIGAARALIEEATETDGDNPELWLWKAQLAQSQEEWKAAEDAYIRALEDIGQYDVMTFEKYQTISALIQVLRAQNKSSEAFVYEELLAKSGPGTIRSNLIAARDAYEQGRFTEAARYLEEVLTQAPAHEQSALMLGMIRFRQGRTEEAEKLLAPLAEMGDSKEASKLLAATRLQMRDTEGAQAVLDNLKDQDTDPGTLALVGIASLASGDIETGESLLERSLELNPDNHQLRIRYATYLSRTGKHERALKQAQQVISEAPELDAAWTVVIETQLASDDPGAAVKTADNWINKQPDNLSALIAGGNLAAREGNTDAARQLFNQAKDKHPEAEAPLTALGRLAITEGNEQQAEEYLRQAVSLAPDSLRALQGLASLLDTQALTSYMRTILDDQPDAISPKLILLEASLANGNEDDANELTASLLEREDEDTPSRASPMVARIYNSVASNLAQNNESNRATKILERGLILFPENENIAMQAARLAFNIGEITNARRILQEAKQQHPDSPRPYLVEASYFQQQNEFRQAADLYELALNKEPSAATKAAYAQALQQAGRIDDALASLESAVEEHPDTPRLLLNLAMMQQSAGKPDSAQANYERLLELSPNNALVLNNLAWLYYEKGNDKALDLAKRAYEINSENAAIADTYGWILFKAGNHEESIPVLEKAHLLQPDSEEIGLHLAEAYRASGRNSEAQKILEKFGEQG